MSDIVDNNPFQVCVVLKRFMRHPSIKYCRAGERVCLPPQHAAVHERKGTVKIISKALRPSDLRGQSMTEFLDSKEGEKFRIVSGREEESLQLKTLKLPKSTRPKKVGTVVQK